MIMKIQESLFVVNNKYCMKGVKNKNPCKERIFLVVNFGLGLWLGLATSYYVTYKRLSGAAKDRVDDL